MKITIELNDKDFERAGIDLSQVIKPINPATGMDLNQNNRTYKAPNPFAEMMLKNILNDLKQNQSDDE